MTLGLAAGFRGGWVDLVLSRITEIVMCFPTFFLIIAVIAFLEPSIVNIMAVIGGVAWTNQFRLIRGEVLKVRNLEYITAARALGIPTTRIMFRHVLPNAISPIFVSVAFGVASSVLLESSLSFLGFGDPKAVSWGQLLYGDLRDPDGVQPARTGPARRDGSEAAGLKQGGWRRDHDRARRVALCGRCAGGSGAGPDGEPQRGGRSGARR